jgi:arylsulfatase A-like enzyme
MAAVGFAAGAASQPVGMGVAKRPNILFVMSDQQSWDMLGCYGNKDLITPQLDRLARQGVRFNHCISNSPVCTPYRSILMSGQHPLLTGGLTNDLQILPGGGRYFGEVLRDAGDRVRPIPPGPYRYGFDFEFLTNNCTLLFDKERSNYWDVNGERKLYGDWEPYAQTRQAMQFIDKHADKPFALFLSWHPPHNWGREHAGYNAPEDCLKLYDPAMLHLRPTVKDTPDVRQKYQGHMAMISSLDRSFGWLMDKLEQKNLSDNTIVVFTSDHGDLLMSYDWPMNKGRAEHGSCQVPLLIRYPGRLKPGVSELLIGTFDLMPTLLGMMGLSAPATCQGHNLAAAIAEGRSDVVEFQPLFFLPADWRGIYTRRYTYSFTVRTGSSGKEIQGKKHYNRLFDRVNDPWETRNLYDVPEYAEVQRSLHKQTLDWMKSFGDSGFTFEWLLRQVIREEDYPAVATNPPKRPRGWEGRLKGRPLDILTSLRNK